MKKQTDGGNVFEKGDHLLRYGSDKVFYKYARLEYL